MDTLVVGAGVAGLAYAQARGEADLRVVDAAPRAGGLVRTGRAELPGLGALRFEWGPEALQDSEPDVRALLRELALGPRPCGEVGERRYLCKEGRLVALPAAPLELLSSSLLSPTEKLRALSEPMRARGVALDGSVADFARHRFGEGVLRRFVDPLVSGIYAGDPEQLSLRAAFPKLHALVAEHGSVMGGLKARAKAKREAGDEVVRGAPGLFTLEGGLGALTDALAARLGARLRLGLRVTALRRDGDGWLAQAQPVSDAAPPPPVELRARRLVLSLPVAATARLLQDAAPDVARELSDMTSESLVSVSHAWRREQVGHALDGFGYLAPSVERRLHLGTLFSSSLAPSCAPAGVVLLRTLMGGARQPRTVEWPDAELLAELDGGVASLLQIRGAPLWTQIVRHRAILPRYDLRHPQRLAAVDAALAKTPGLVLLGNWRQGLSVPSLLAAARAAARA